MPQKDDAYYATLSDDAAFLVDFHGPSMFSTEGDAAVIGAIEAIKALVATDLTIRNKKGLLLAAKPILLAVAAEHDEMTDTEPDGWIAGKLRDICKDMGWAYDDAGWTRDEFDWRYAK